MTSLRPALLLLTLAACIDLGGDGDGSDGSDGGGADGGGTSGDTFLYRAMILTMTGVECVDDCPAEVDLQPCGEMTNNTDEEQAVTTPSTCLVEEWVVSGPEKTETLQWDCVHEPYDRYFGPGESQGFCFSGWSGVAGSYSMVAEFGTGETASLDFKLQ